MTGLVVYITFHPPHHTSTQLALTTSNFLSRSLHPTLLICTSEFSVFSRVSFSYLASSPQSPLAPPSLCSTPRLPPLLCVVPPVCSTYRVCPTPHMISPTYITLRPFLVCIPLPVDSSSYVIPSVCTPLHSLSLPYVVSSMYVYPLLMLSPTYIAHPPSPLPSVYNYYSRV